ncbi:MAG: 1-acyl-sn-glycerol-3-phosphate acyltransferase [Parachlamydiaceae bacterium]
MFGRLKNIWTEKMEVFHSFLFWLSHTLLLPLRYQIEVKGQECLDPKRGGVNRSVLFLSNHSSHIDASILGTVILREGLSLSIWALDLTFKLPYLRWAARRKESIQVVKVPNIPAKRSEKHTSHLHKLVTRTADGLRKGKNFLIFPSGVVKKTPMELIHGKSAVTLIVQQCPNVPIILVRITGLWGSRFSYATPLEARWGTQSVQPLRMVWKSLKMLLLNAVFFIPKRKVLVEFIPVGPDFPRFGTRVEVNRYLENTFNASWGPMGESLYVVPDYFWRSSYLTHEYQTKEYVFNLNLVPKALRNAVVTLIADKANLDCSEVNFNMSLGRDLGLDSLDLVEILSELETQYDIGELVPENLTTVGHLIAIVAKIPIACVIKSGVFH